MANLINGYELLPGADLPEAFLAGVVFSGNLSGANLSGALLYSSILNRVNLQGANLTDANLEGTHLAGANLRGANLAGANLRGANLAGANLRGANLTNANLRGAHLNDINLQDAILNGANLEGAHFVMNDLHGANLEGIGHLPEVQPPPPVQPPPEAVAFETHNYFDILNINEIARFLQEFNIGHADFNPNTISGSASENSEQSLFTPLLIFIDKSDLFRPDEKESNKQRLNRVLTIVTHYSRFEVERELLNSVVEFVSKQSDGFIEQYIRTLIDESLNAYGKGEGNESCVKGVFERITTVIGAVAIILTKDESMNQDNETYKILKQIFRQINFGELVQEWATTYLEDGEKEEELRSLSLEERKSHFINFMMTKYQGLINPAIRRKIREEADQYQQYGVFERMAMGKSKKMRRTRRSKKTKTKKTTRTKRSKRSKKIINKYSKKKTKK
jgi:hypothetical protein